MASPFKANRLIIRIPFLIIDICNCINLISQRCYLLILPVCTTPAIQMPKGLVYKHFTESGDNVSCNYFDKTYKKTTTTSSTNPLWYHLKAAHSIAPTEKRAPAAKKPKMQQGLITIFIEKKSQQEMN